MEVKPGYKQTHLGIIPKDWDVMTLSDVCHSICDGTHYTPRYVPQGIPFYSVENLTANDFENTKYITEEEHTTLIKRCKPERGDILMTRITAGIVGDTRLIDWDVNASIYVSLALLKPNNRIDSEYLYRYSRSTTFVRETEKRALTNATPKKINMQDIGAIPIPVPRDVEEQCAIAAALGDVDALLDGLDRLIAKKRDLKQVAMQQLLTGETRLPGFLGEWMEKRLGDLATLKNGYAFKSTTYTPLGALKIITIANVQDGYMDAQECNRINDEPCDLQSHHRLQQGDILISMTGNVGRVCRVTEDNCLLNQRIGKLEPVDVQQKFLFHLLRQKHFLAEMAVRAKGGAQGNLSVHDITDFEFVLPLHKEEQEAIAEVLSDMDAEIEALEKRRAKMADLKQAMMQELLTGKTRLIKPGATDA